MIAASSVSEMSVERAPRSTSRTTVSAATAVSAPAVPATAMSRPRVSRRSPPSSIHAVEVASSVTVVEAFRPEASHNVTPAVPTESTIEPSLLIVAS